MIRLAGMTAAIALLLTVSANAADPSLSAAANQAYLAQNALKKGVVTEPSGLQHRSTHIGFGARPSATSKVEVLYKGMLINGKVFDQTEEAAGPVTFKTNNLISGWTQALELMREGDEWELVIPANLAYGARGAGNGAIPPDQTLVFDLTLVKVLPPDPHDNDKDDGSGGGDDSQH
jgi:FKBP-type peptidyl-prolyl cis-trans isomerase